MLNALAPAAIVTILAAAWRLQRSPPDSNQPASEESGTVQPPIRLALTWLYPRRSGVVLRITAEHRIQSARDDAARVAATLGSIPLPRGALSTTASKLRAGPAR